MEADIEIGIWRVTLVLSLSLSSTFIFFNVNYDLSRCHVNLVIIFNTSPIVLICQQTDRFMSFTRAHKPKLWSSLLILISASLWILRLGITSWWLPWLHPSLISPYSLKVLSYLLIPRACLFCSKSLSLCFLSVQMFVLWEWRERLWETS